MTLAYRKLRTSRTMLGSSNRLYINEDHLLSVESNSYSEKYYRFYFSDIQAVIVRRTDRGAIWSIVLGLIALLMTTCSISAIPAGDWAPTNGYFILALAAAVIMIVNLVKGPSCQTHIQTSVTVQKIGALHRLKKTEEILPEIRSLIRTAQGSLTREDIIQSTVMPEEEISLDNEPAAKQRIQEHEPAVKNPARFHMFAFSMMIVSSGLDTIWLFSSGLALYIVVAVATLTAFIGIVAALIVQTRRNTVAVVRKITWALFIFQLAGYAAAVTINIYYSFREGLRGNTDYNIFSQFTDIVDKGWMDKPGLVYLTAASIVISVVLAGAGLVYLDKSKRNRPETVEGKRQETSLD